MRLFNSLIIQKFYFSFVWTDLHTSSAVPWQYHWYYTDIYQQAHQIPCQWLYSYIHCMNFLMGELVNFFQGLGEVLSRHNLKTLKGGNYFIHLFRGWVSIKISNRSKYLKEVWSMWCYDWRPQSWRKWSLRTSVLDPRNLKYNPKLGLHTDLNIFQTTGQHKLK